MNRSILTNINTPSDVDGGTAIESSDIDLVNGQTRSKYYSNRQAMSFMYNFGFTGSVASSGRGFVVGAASGVTAGAAAAVGWANATAQYWAVPQSNGDFSSPLMKPGTYTQTLYQGELAVATRTVTVTGGGDHRPEHRVGLGHARLADLPDRYLGRHPERVPELSEPDLDAPLRCADGQH